MKRFNGNTMTEPRVEIPEEVIYTDDQELQDEEERYEKKNK